MHLVLQEAFTWFGGHLHQFSTGNRREWNAETFLTDFDIEEGDEGTPENHVRLDQVMTDVGDKLYYTYDFATTGTTSSSSRAPPRARWMRRQPGCSRVAGSRHRTTAAASTGITTWWTRSVTQNIPTTPRCWTGSACMAEAQGGTSTRHTSASRIWTPTSAKPSTADMGSPPTGPSSSTWITPPSVSGEQIPPVLPLGDPVDVDRLVR